MSLALAAVGAVLAWIGAGAVILADARLGVTLGLGLAAAGLGLAVVASGHPMAAAALAGAGIVSGLLRLRDGEPGWGLMAPGSTPRVVGTLIAALAAAALTGSGLATVAGLLRAAGAVVSALAVLRLLGVRSRWSALGAGTLLVLGLGALGGTVPLLAAAAAALALGLAGRGGAVTA
jgi:hypothetical protein